MTKEHNLKCIIVSMLNNKGGVGKTTLVANLGHAMALRGMRVLIIDQDPQANCSGIFRLKKNDKTLYDFYSGEATLEECIGSTNYAGVDIIPNENETAALEVGLYMNAVENAQRLLELRTLAQDRYDVVLIDNSPSLSIYTMMSLLASDGAIIPLESGSQYSIDGFNSALKAIGLANSRVNHELKFLKAIINKADLRTNLSKQGNQMVKERFTGKVFDTVIPLNTIIGQAESKRQTVIRWSPTTNGSKAFGLWADEVIEFLGLERQP